MVILIIFCGGGRADHHERTDRCVPIDALRGYRCSEHFSELRVIAVGMVGRRTKPNLWQSFVRMVRWNFRSSTVFSRM